LSNNDILNFITSHKSKLDSAESWGFYWDFDEYKVIKNFYGNRVTKRSGVPLINHINEGLLILDYLDATIATKRAYCIHPIIQSDVDLKNNLWHLFGLDTYTIILAMEYRKTANAYLSRRKINSIDEIELSPLEEVNQMLIADKIQNRKDFDLYHNGIHPRSKELDEYFQNWFNRLGIK